MSYRSCRLDCSIGGHIPLLSLEVVRRLKAVRIVLGSNPKERFNLSHGDLPQALLLVVVRSNQDITPIPRRIPRDIYRRRMDELIRNIVSLLAFLPLLVQVVCFINIMHAVALPS